jgi:uncharacterized membrane protein YdbT with pleckstrin-like domain
MDLLEGERVLWQGNPSWKSLLLFYVKWTLISLIPLVLWYAWDATAGDAPSSILITLTVLALVATFLGGWIKRATTRYRVTDRRINVRTGLVSRHDASTHLDRVQNVNINQTAFQRLLGVGNIDWDTAGTDSGDADFTFYGIDDPSGLMHIVDSALHASSAQRSGGI